MSNIILPEDVVINANKLRNNNAQKRLLRENIIEIMRRINEELKIAHREGKHSVITTIPITFEIPNSTNKESQRIIYSKIIECLINNNYRVFINPKTDECRIKITWLSKDDECEIDNQNILIAKCTQPV